MRPEDVRDYLRLRRLTTNPGAIVRFRKRQRAGQDLVVALRDGPGLRIRGSTSDFHIFHRIFLRDEYALAALPAGEPLGTVLDIGANVGIFTARIAPRARRVIAYEASPANLALLEANVRGWPGVEVVGEAVAGKPGSLQLYRPPSAGSSGLHSVYAQLEGRRLSEDYDEVPAVTLETIFERHAIGECDLLKIDVEGAEYDILYAVTPALFQRVRRIHGEYHDADPGDPRTRIAHFAQFLRDMGFGVRVAPHREKDNHGMFFAQRI